MNVIKSTITQGLRLISLEPDTSKHQEILDRVIDAGPQRREMEARLEQI
jgi:hypothetical protein